MNITDLMWQGNVIRLKKKIKIILYVFWFNKLDWICGYIVMMITYNGP